MSVKGRLFLETEVCKLAYCKSDGKYPWIVFLGGFAGSMEGVKSQYIRKWAEDRGLGSVFFDYIGHGDSSGGLVDGSVGKWKQNCLDAIDNVVPTDASMILVGSSLGGWLMSPVAEKYGDRVVGMLGLASAPDFVVRFFWEKLMNDEQRNTLKTTGSIDVPWWPVRVTYEVIEEARNHLVLGRKIDTKAKVILLHGSKDDEIPVQYLSYYSKSFDEASCRTYVVEGANHRMARDEDLQLIGESLAELVDYASTLS